MIMFISDIYSAQFAVVFTMWMKYVVPHLLPRYLIHYICKYLVINFAVFLFVLTTQSKFHVNSEDMFFFCPFEGQALQVW